MDKSDFIGIIPARYASTRFPGKPLVEIGGKSMIQRVYEQVSKVLDAVCVATDDQRIFDAVVIGEGSIVMAGAVINPGTKIGRGVIVNTSSSVDHDCRIGDFVHIAVGAHLCGTVTAGEKTWIGAGATVINNISICNDCMIGAGAVIVKDITEQGTYVGVPARFLK